MARLSIDLTDQQHRDLKTVAALQGKTIKQFALERLFAASGALSDEDRAWEELKALLDARVAEVDAGKFSTMTIDEIFDDVLRQDEAA